MYSKKLEKIETGLSFSDVLLLPQESQIEPSQTDVSSVFSKKIKLNMPIAAAAMDTVSEKEMATTMSRLGGLAVIHRNMSREEQVKQINEVKDAGFIKFSILSCQPNSSVQDAKKLMEENNVSGLPVLNGNSVVGIITYTDLRFAADSKDTVKKYMTKDVVTVPLDIQMNEAFRIMKKNKISRLPVLEGDNLVGIITEGDIRKEQGYKDALTDKTGSFLAVAAVGPFDLERAKMLDKAGADALVVDTAHGHNMNVVNGAKKILKEVDAEVIVGNIATSEAAEALISAGVDGIKVGIGPGSICTTRIIAGVGVPQISAISAVADVAKDHKIPVIADGGIVYSGDIAKAIAAGADCVMLGNLLAGTDESPGRLTIVEGRKYKQYRGMGSLGAMATSADRYFQEGVPKAKNVPEGVEGLVPYTGPVNDVLHQLVGGLRASMGYLGAKTVPELKKKGKFLKITSGGSQESHPHDVMITDEAPNYYKVK
ncbi:IMP dehydrogenase [Candidatus Undinarchaeota archaeon]